MNALIKLFTPREVVLYPIIEDCMNLPGRFVPNYDCMRANLYLGINRDAVIKFLLNNWSDVNFDKNSLVKIIKTEDSKVLEDMRRVLVNSLLTTYQIKEMPVSISDSHAKKDLERIIRDNLNETIFRRTTKQHFM